MAKKVYVSNDVFKYNLKADRIYMLDDTVATEVLAIPLKDVDGNVIGTIAHEVL